MINNLISRGRFLFIKSDCPYCSLYKKFIFKLNNELKPEKRIRIIDCTRYDLYGVCDNPIIKIFERHLESYPTLFIDGSKKVGANSVLECKAWLKARLFTDFYFEQEPDYFPTIRKYSLFDSQCKHRQGRIICE